MLVLKLVSLRKAENRFTSDQKKKKMLQKNTIYHTSLSTIPSLVRPHILKQNVADPLQSVAYLLFLDMLQILKMWRHIKGYPTNGQTTYTNANNSKKNKLLLNFRLEQFYALFGKKKRNIFPTLIQAEYNNRL